MRWLFALLFVLLSGCTLAELRGFEPSNLFSQQRPGDYLSSTQYERMIIEIIPTVGGPVIGIEALTVAARRLCRKPAGVEVEVRDPIQVESKKWTKDALYRLRDNVAQHHTKANTAVLHVVAVPGGFEEDFGSTAGVVFCADMICLFPDRGQPTDKVLVHEFGHILGLVNGGTPAASKHWDPDSPSHCKDQTCIMFWAINDQTGDFDQACLKDLGRE